MERLGPHTPPGSGLSGAQSGESVCGECPENTPPTQVFTVGSSPLTPTGGAETCLLGLYCSAGLFAFVFTQLDPELHYQPDFEHCYKKQEPDTCCCTEGGASRRGACLPTVPSAQAPLGGFAGLRVRKHNTSKEQLVCLNLANMKNTVATYFFPLCLDFREISQ